MADLAPPKQDALRRDVCELMLKHNLPCFYEAIHVAGFHRPYIEQRQHFMGKGNRVPPESLHVALFQGLYSTLIAFCLERQRTTLHLEVITDRVDSPIIKEFENVAEEFLNFESRIGNITTYDQKLKKRVKVGEFKISGSPAENIPVTVKQLDLVIVDDMDGIVLAADVIANSLAYLFHQRPPNELYKALNRQEAIEDHPLAHCLSAFWNPGSYSFSDHFYAHPSDPG